MGKIRSALRNISRFWKPIQAKRKSVSVGVGKARKYYCESCKSLVSEIEIDHATPAGSLRSYEDLPGFCERLFVEDVSLLVALCKPCHLEKTHSKPLM